MPEPTLKEIEQARVDPEIATGEPAVVYDNTQLLDTLNKNAQFKAQNDWNKYNRFLNDYQERLKTQQDIADKGVLDSDRDDLKKESVELFSTALKNPNSIYSPEFNSKLAGIRANATSSKQARDFAEQNAQFMVIHPEFNTDENKKKIDDYVNGQTIKNGGRKMFTLDAPDVFDNVGYFNSLKTQTGETENKSYISPDQQFIHERQDTKYKYKPFLEMIKSGYDSNPRVRKKAKADFESLPEEIKKNFEDPKDYWVNFGSKHFGSNDDIVQQGKEDIKANPQFLKREELGLREKQLNQAAEQNKIENWYRGQQLEQQKGNKSKIEKTVKNETEMPLKALISSVGIINSSKPLTSLPKSLIAAIDPEYLNSDGEITSAAKKNIIRINPNYQKGGYEVVVYDEGGKNRIKTIDGNNLNTNARSWISAGKASGKILDVYDYDEDTYNNTVNTFFNESMNRVKKNMAPQNTQSNTQEKIPALTTREQFNALPKGAFYYRGGKKYQK